MDDGGFRVIANVSFVSMDFLAVYNYVLMAGFGGGVKRICTKVTAKHP